MQCTALWEWPCTKLVRSQLDLVQWLQKYVPGINKWKVFVQQNLLNFLDFWDNSEGENRTAVSQQLLQQCYFWNSSKELQAGSFSLHLIKSLYVHWKNSVQVTPRQLFWPIYSRHWPSNESSQMSGQQLANMVQLLYFSGVQPGEHWKDVPRRW